MRQPPVVIPAQFVVQAQGLGAVAKDAKGDLVGLAGKCSWRMGRTISWKKMRLVLMMDMGLLGAVYGGWRRNNL